MSHKTTPLPNLLIAGVAKCGTSSLHQYIEQHPDIFMSEVKEPRYISSKATNSKLGGPMDYKVESWYVKDYEKYLALFGQANGEKIIGESSADTFYFHEKTIPVIKELLGDPKIIIVLRNPTKRAFSAYQHLRRDDREHLSFEDGLEAEPERIAKNYELIYHYKAVGLYHKGIEAFKQNFSNVKVILNEDLATNPVEVLKEVFEFLGVSTEIEIDVSQKHNMSGIPRSRWLHELLFEGKRIIIYLRPFVRFFLSKSKRDQISRKIQQKNLKRLEIDPNIKKQLIKYFDPDIQKTENLINRKLDSWRN